MWIPRLLADSLQRAARQRPAVLVTGARQTGKSSLMRKVFAGYAYVTLDSPLEALQAKEDPEAFLDRHGEPLIVDEIQYAPDLFRHIKIRIDSDRERSGRFLLTGSQTFALMTGVRESLAGRVRVLNLGTLAAKELRDDGRFTPIQVEDLPRRGGFPELWARTELDAGEFFEDYIATYLERDLRRVVAVREIGQFRRFLGLLAARIGNLLNYADVARSVGVSAHTISDWTSALEASGLVFLLPPWFDNPGKRLTKSPKVYFGDTGLALHLNGVAHDAQLPLIPIWGSLWENFVVLEMIRTHGLTPGRDVFFYRDHNGLEVDAVIRGDSLSLIEIKTAASLPPKVPNLKKVRDALASVPGRSGQAQTRLLVAAPIGAESPVKLADVTIFDPRYGDLP